MIPQVVVRDAGGAQTVRKVFIDGHELNVYAVSVRRSADDITRVTLELPAEYLEEDA